MFAQPGIAATCTLNVPALNFGVYDTVGDLAMTTTITVSCSGVGNGLPFDLSVSQDSGSYAPRKMQRSGGGPILDYYLYTDASRAITWGDGKTGGTGVIHGTVVKGASSANATVYGLVRGGQSVSPGSYASTAPATVTVSY
jgi:spore coat protein U-like protein